MKRAIALGLAVGMLGGGTAWASDHGDTPALAAANRQDANITDLHVFTTGEHDKQLVISLCLNPTIPPSAQSYRFASDLTLKLMIDNHSEVLFDDAAANAKFGGTFSDPAHIAADITFTVTFDAAGTPHLAAQGYGAADASGDNDALKNVRLFAGLRDDPFIRGPRIGRNSACVVAQMPLRTVAKENHPAILVWAASQVPDIDGPIADLGARALRSMFPENNALNSFINPADHYTVLGVQPDVVIFDTSRPAAYPNGRALTDDVVDLVNDPRILKNDAPFPSTNDVPFLATFPYVAPPHNAPDTGFYSRGNQEDRGN